MTQAIGQNRHNDTPIGGKTEFRANLQGGDVWQVDTVPAWDGEKFAPATNSALLNAYGGLAVNDHVATAADGSIIAGWDAVTPLNGTPLQCTPDPVTGLITLAQIGVYQIDFAANLAGLVNNQSYAFLLNVGGVDQSYGAAVSGTNSLDVGTVNFSISAENATTDVPIGVTAFNAGSNTYEIVTASLSVRRIG